MSCQGAGPVINSASTDQSTNNQMLCAMQVARVLGRLCDDLLDVPPIRGEIDRCV